VVPFLSTCQLSRAATTPAPSLSLPLSLFLRLSPSLSPRYSITNSTVPVLARYSEPPDRPLSAAAAGGTSVTQNERKVEVAIDVLRGYARIFPPRRFHECIDRSSGVPFRRSSSRKEPRMFTRSACAWIARHRSRSREHEDRSRLRASSPAPSLSPSLFRSVFPRSVRPIWIRIPKRSRNE